MPCSPSITDSSLAEIFTIRIIIHANLIYLHIFMYFYNKIHVVMPNIGLYPASWYFQKWLLLLQNHDAFSNWLGRQFCPYFAYPHRLKVCGMCPAKQEASLCSTSRTVLISSTFQDLDSNSRQAVAMVPESVAWTTTPPPHKGKHIVIKYYQWKHIIWETLL